MMKTPGDSTPFSTRTNSEWAMMYYPIIAACIFVPLMLVFFLSGYGPELAGQELPLSFGILAYSLVLAEVIFSTRPRFLERKPGLVQLYAIHGMMALVLLVVAALHIVMEVMLVSISNLAIPTAPLGLLGFLFLVISTGMGILFLSSNFIGRSKKLMKSKDTPHRRERALWLHRLSLLAVIVLFGHIVSIPAIRTNTVFVGLLAVYTLCILLYYIWEKAASHRASYRLTDIKQPAPDVYQMTFSPLNGDLLPYQAGQYVFVRFTRSRLPKESHPFSITTRPASGEGSLSVMAKKSGDYTAKLDLLKVGDLAAIEGPYGNFMDAVTSKGQSPLVFLAGGIGITPILSILKEQLEKNPHREMHLVWGSSTLKDTFYTDQFAAWAKDAPNFSFNLILSREKVAPYPQGQISADYLSSIGVDTLYRKAHFFICGPAGMMAAAETILKDHKVDSAKIHIEKFSF